MLITRISSWSGLSHALDIPVTVEQIQQWRGGMLIQRAMPDLLPWQREFMMTGMTDVEWQEMTVEQAEYEAAVDAKVQRDSVGEC